MGGTSSREWVGRDVLVEIIGGVNYQMVGRLDGVSDTDIVVTRGDPSGEPVFFPGSAYGDAACTRGGLRPALSVRVSVGGSGITKG